MMTSTTSTLVWAAVCVVLIAAVGVHAADDGGEEHTCPDGVRILDDRRHDSFVERKDPPPRYLPEGLKWAYTRCGAIKVADSDYYVDDFAKGEGTHYQFDAQTIEQYVSTAKDYIGADEDHLKRLGKSGWTYQAVQRAGLQGKSVVVFGSMDPRVEAICLAAGAKHVTTVEYNQLTFDHEQLTTITAAEFAKREAEFAHSFDVAISLSSFDHDGLGRYGDPLAPDGDLMAMDQVRRVLKPDGVFIFSVPVGDDLIVWNLHRRYGPVRLPLLLQGWDRVDAVQWHEVLVSHAGSSTNMYEPVLLLKPSSDPNARTAHTEGPQPHSEL